MKILCFGDSNTYGYDPRGYWGGRYAPADRWPEILAAQTGWDVVSLGENGRAIPGTSVGIPLSGDRLLVMLGTNDLLQGAPAARAGERMRAFLADLLPRFPDTVLLCPPPMQLGAWVPTDALITESKRLGAEYEALAGRYSIPFVDTRDWNIQLAFDGVHFTEEGHRTFARNLRKELCP